ncbi:TetR/AcrR family transcriptional regulator [Sphingopyxis sp.]|uniref:TetR/AcrR family transcriptional regulator n=1 Tax=Sphingopyxis sp. TaxID=1908224 RepID=UPI001DB828EB|nr:TetR/AcrR family transcriptional regulator [Sphingopyxis sp.]MBW8294507.1 TetR/AcrR family transcriptional regulator [Sphingopyxis sp.]
MPRKHLSADERRAATVQAVIALAADQNPADITTAQIAAHMGVTQGALFRHFADKDAIWSAVMGWTSQERLRRFEGQGSDNPIQTLRIIFDAHIAFVVAYPGVPRIVFGELQRRNDSPAKTQVKTLMACYRDKIAEQIEIARKLGLISEHIDLAAAATLLLGMIQGMVMQAMAADDFSSMSAMSQRLFPLYLTSLGVRI